MTEGYHRYYDAAIDTPRTGWDALAVEQAVKDKKILLIDPFGEIWAEDDQGEREWIGRLAGGAKQEEARRAAKVKQNERHISGDQ